MIRRAIGYTEYFCVAFALAGFIIGFVVDAIRKTKTELSEHLGRTVAAGGVPLALVLVYGAFDRTILVEVQGLSVPILLGGLSLLYVSFKAALPSVRRIDK